MYKIPAKPVDFLRFLGYGDNFEKLRFVFENDALRLKMREHFVLRIINRVECQLPNKRLQNSHTEARNVENCLKSSKIA